MKAFPFGLQADGETRESIGFPNPGELPSSQEIIRTDQFNGRVKLHLCRQNQVIKELGDKTSSAVVDADGRKPGIEQCIRLQLPALHPLQGSAK